ncbi:copper oxidase [Vandammella animalimorsus]|uniref:Copper oxidase n=1 Tax=Vandammella animalimorsus TaxID=2029117 RepID=A0A2A2T964_9BURK|nr:multicopper oxidase family protein [Vandammella animalimorsus]PAT33417.1 copper oxidase [Vandammella animalimorsus]PAX18341.1 copper oxidase [Vandammella animalimorsus]PAX20504.1 copper oxidase [Vandammella animalimorsus]
MPLSHLQQQRRRLVLGLGASAALAPLGLRAAMDSHAELVYTGSSELAPLSALHRHRAHQRLPRLPNRSRRPGLFRGRIVAMPAQLQLAKRGRTAAYCYNLSTPGPLVEVYEGDRVEIDFFNRLPQPSTIHWHGLAIPADQDGAPQDFIPAGGHRRYQFTLPPGSAGTHWYHPHPHMLTAEQVYRGLAGALIVRDRNDPLRHIPEQELFISDLKLGQDGQILPNDREDWMNGREGQFILINGRQLPLITLAGTQRWRIWNACSARYLRLSLDGVPFTLVGTDGGLLGAPRRNLQELLLAPAERAEIIVSAQPGQQRAQLIAEPYDRGAMGRLAGPSQRRLLADIDMLLSPQHPALDIPDVLRPIAELQNPTAQHMVAFSDYVDLQAAPPSNPYERPKDMLFLVNGQAYDLQRVDIEGQLGAVEEWTLVNASAMGMDHPFHIHGGHFQVIEREYQGQVTPEPFLAWRDMLNLRAGESARIRMCITEPGLRMFHCHILEHEDLGMMGNLLVR